MTNYLCMEIGMNIWLTMVLVPPFALAWMGTCNLALELVDEQLHLGQRARRLVNMAGGMAMPLGFCLGALLC
jgi:hypothetical protein